MTDTSAEQKTTVSMTVDGRAVEAVPGEMIIAAAERAGTYIPRFCYHPRMRSVGMCRMCLVEVVGPRGPQLQPACYVPVAEGQEVITDSPAVKKAQDGVLELLLINHPLDCPVCDRGGECPLQDQTLTFGPGETRFVEEKRHWEKPIPLSSLVLLDRERCIQCDRCTRFADEIAGDPLIDFVGRGDHTEINTFPDQPFASYFSGNVVQLCPVGALTAEPYRFKARPWDLEQVESTCTSCSVGCRVAVQSSGNRITRRLGIDADPVNQGWLCDKGRFDYEAVNGDDRLRAPLSRSGDTLGETTWGEALGKAADALAGARDRHGPASIAVLGGARLTNEDAYAWSKLARVVLGTDNVDCQLADGLPAEVVLGLPHATIDEACEADTVVLLTADVKEELPVLYLRLRGAAVAGATNLVELSATTTGLTRYATTSVRYRPGEAAEAARQLVAGGAVTGDKVVCVLGRPSLAEQPDSVIEAAGVLLDAVPGIRFLSGLRRANVHGALDMGLAPGLLPGRVAAADDGGWFAGAWGTLPETEGLGAAGILEAAAAGRIQALVLLGADPLADVPDRDLAQRALAGAGFVLALDGHLTASSRQADVVLPVVLHHEKPGTATNLEGRVTRLGQKITPPGSSRPDWMVAVELASRLGGDLGLETLDQITDEIATLAPAYEGITRAALAAAHDGLLAGRDDASAHEAPPTMSSAEHPEVHAAAALGETDIVASEPIAVRETPEPAAAKPPTLRHRPAGRTATPPATDSYSLRLVSSRALYDEGTLVQHSPSLAHLGRGAAVRVNPAELERLGVTDGAQVRVSSSRASLTLLVAVDEGVPRGVAALDYNQAGPGAADLIDIATAVTDVRVETV
ncbi:MAG: NADH-quinone oxidoreductase subunit NuoG [Acidobacteria bacterium]|nr:NADH-quinone oxidoreductase subunit NuoG [Acidobacteriota bacterium]